MKRYTSPVAVLILCLVLGTGCISETGNLTASEVTDRYLHEQEAIRDLSQTVEITRNYYPRADRFFMMKKSPRSYRLEYLASGSEYTGTLVVTNGNIIWWYSPAARSVKATAHFDPNATYLSDRDFQAGVTDLIRKYPRSATLAGFDRGNNSFILEFTHSSDESRGLPGDYPKTRVWIDAESWVARKIVLHNLAWNSTLTVEYRDIRINNGIPESEFVFNPRNVPHPPEESRNHPPEYPSLSLKEAYRGSGSDLVVPSLLPEGYSYRDGSETWDGARILWILNGSKSVCYVDSPVIGKPFLEPFDGDPSEVQVNGTYGVFRTGKDQNQLEWIQDGHDYSLTGGIDRADLVKMAASLVHVNDRLLQTLPQEEHSLVKPLAVFDLTSIIMPVSWIRSRDNSTTPGIIDIRLSSREFDETFAKSKEYPDFLVHHHISSDERVALYQVPRILFAQSNRDPQMVVLNHPESMFRYYPDLNALFKDRCKSDKIPSPAAMGGSHA